MFAVIKTGGKQYKVGKDDVIVVEKLEGEAGEVVAFESVLMFGEGAGAKSGSPFVEGVCVAVEVVEQTRGDKILVFKKKRRQNYRRTNRSEERTSELQSLMRISYAVFCLKKKKQST